ncbi:MAG TPA: hypothetical protein VF616_24840 [Duganella sp.]|uniref:hypothetical protein n=1 Tax=Duganella sp. TaxID=1904440 RepID=UPI002ED206B8
MNDDPIWAEEIADEILDYLQLHPSAMESRDGILQCWILQRRFLRGLAALDVALERLLAEGRIEGVPGADGRMLYRAPRR